MKKLLMVASFGLLMAACTTQSRDEVTPEKTPDIQASTERINCSDRLTYANLNGGGLDVAATSNYVFKVAANKVIQVYDTENFRWISLGSQGKRITADDRNNIWITNDRNEIYHGVYNPATQSVARWNRLNGKATDIGASLSGRLYILGDSERNGEFAVYRRSGSRWVKMRGSGRRIAGGNSGADIWLINKKNDIYKYVGSSWIKIGGRARDIAQSGGSNAHTYIVGNTSNGADGYPVYVYNGGWCKVGGFGTNIAVKGEFPIVVNGRKQIFKGCKVLPDGISSVCPF